MDNKDKIRLKTVQRVDPHVVRIEDSASRTALYTYEELADAWVKTEVEGTLMIYSREAPPHNMMIIINRMNKSDFMEPLTSKCEITENTPYLLIRNSKDTIFGIWFSESDDVHRVAVTVQSKINEDSAQGKIPSQPVPSNVMQTIQLCEAPSAGEGDILSMLSRAHGEFKNKQDGTPSELVKPFPMRVTDPTSSDVSSFFSKVGMSPVAPKKAAEAMAGPTTNPVLQKLFQGAAAVGGQASVAGSGSSGNIGATSTPIPTSKTIPPSPLPCNLPPAMASMSLQELEGKLKEDLHITPCLEDKSHFSALNVKPQYQLSAGGNTSLLSPQVFTVPELLSIRGCESNPAPLIPPSAVAFTPLSSAPFHPPLMNGSRSATDVALTPLTHDQLVQAFTLLLKKNDFVQELHEAYIQALRQSLNG